jgi:hypothetical protein
MALRSIPGRPQLPALTSTNNEFIPKLDPSWDRKPIPEFAPTIHRSSRRIPTADLRANRGNAPTQAEDAEEDRLSLSNLRILTL